MRSIGKRYVVLAVSVVLIAGLVGIAVLVLMFGGLPLEDGTQLADGRITVVADRWGPVTIGAYLFELGNGGYGLIDSTMDPEARAIRAALERLGGTAEDIHAIFLTHSHGDHAAGARSFPNAAVYVLDPDADAVGRRQISVTRGLKDGENLDVLGTTIEVFSIPGHTPGSAAYLVHGVLFLGDSAASVDVGVMAPTPFMNDDNEQNAESLRNLAERLVDRRDEVRHIAFGHHGAVNGFAPLSPPNWALGAE